MAGVKRKDKNGINLKDNEYFNANRDLYIYRYYDFLGRQREVTCKTLKGLREKEQLVNRAVANRVDLAKAKAITLDDCFDFVISERTKQGKLRPATKENYVKMWSLAVADTLGKMRVTDIRPAHISALFTELTSEKGYSANTNKYIFLLVNMALTWAVDNDLLLKNPAAKRAVKEAKDTGAEKREHTALSGTQVNDLLDYLENSRFNDRYPYIMFAVHSGLRVSEQCALTWSDVDFEKGTVTINKQIEYKPVDGITKQRIRPPKTKAGYRVVQMDQEMRKALNEQRKINMALGVINTQEVDGYTGFIFVSYTGRPYTVASVNSFLYNIVNTYNKTSKELLPHLSSHDLRHTSITLDILAGMPLADVQYKHGHESAEVTMNIYNHSLEESREQSKDLLSEYLRKVQ